MKKNQAKVPIIFSSDDSEGTDLSFNSSFEEKPVRDQNDIAKNTQLLKDQMKHFFMANPEFEKNMILEKYKEEENLKPNKNALQPRPLSALPMFFRAEPKPVEEKKEEQGAPNVAGHKYWSKMADTILKESKKNTGMPSVEYINQRINIYRAKIEKPSVYDVLLAESKQTNNFQIKKLKNMSETERRKKHIHDKAEEKMRQETGNVKYFSYKKKIQFKMRIKKEEKNLEEKVFQENQNRKDKKEAVSIQLGSADFRSSVSPKSRPLTSIGSVNTGPAHLAEASKKQIETSNTNVNGSSKEPVGASGATSNHNAGNSPPQPKKPRVFERLFQDANRKQEAQPVLDIEEPIDREFKSAVGEEFYRALKNCNDVDSIKRTALAFITNFRNKALDSFDLKNSPLNNIPRFFGDESKEFNVFFPDFSIRNDLTQKEIDDIFERPEKLEDVEGNTFLLRKINKIMNGSIIKYWKNVQDTQK